VKKHNQKGFTVVEVLLVLIFLAIIGFVIYYVVHSQSDSSKDNSNAATIESSGGDNAAQSTSDNGAAVKTDGARYVDFRTGTNKAGIKISTTVDVSRLTGIGSDLKQYFESNLAALNTPWNGESYPDAALTIRALYGDYAVGTAPSLNAFIVWGPKADGSGITDLVGMQDAPTCSRLKDAKIPAQIGPGLDGCMDTNGNLVPYNG